MSMDFVHWALTVEKNADCNAGNQCGGAHGELQYLLSPARQYLQRNIHVGKCASTQFTYCCSLNKQLN